MKDIIYLIGSSDEEKYKIGITTEKNLLKRLKTLQTGNSSELSYVYFFKSKYASKMERTIHRRFYDKRLESGFY
jgi:hypothetical protein